MKVTYLDQNHWIELSRAAYGRASRPETQGVLEAFHQARASGRACFPLSWGHYIETRKRGMPDQRHRLATFMLELSGGITVAPPNVVIRHEIEVALGCCFPGRVVPEPFELLGRGVAHAAADRNLDIPMNWPSGADAMPAPLRAVIEESLRAAAELTFLSGVSQVGDPREWGPITDLTVERGFKTSLEQWRGARSRYSPREIYAVNLSGINRLLDEVLAHHEISRDEFAQLACSPMTLT